MRQSLRFGGIFLCVLALLRALAPTYAATLRLTTIASTNDVAPGSGTGLGQPDGVFSYTPPNVVPDWSFGPPTVVAGGYFAFHAAVQERDAGGNPAGIDTGIWGGAPGRGLAMLFRQRLAAPPAGGKFFRHGAPNVSVLGAVAFFAEAEQVSGLWWGDMSAGAGPVAPLEFAQRLVLPVLAPQSPPPLQAGPYISYYDMGTNLTYNILTKQQKVLFYPGMPASVFGSGVTLNTTITILALTDQGQLMMRLSQNFAGQF